MVERVQRRKEGGKREKRKEGGKSTEKKREEKREISYNFPSI